MIICPKCGNKYIDRPNFCIKCGQPISNEAKVKSLRTPKLNNPECPECRSKVPSHASQCPECDHPFPFASVPEAILKTCPTCGLEGLSEDASKCPRCEHLFGIGLKSDKENGKRKAPPKCPRCGLKPLNPLVTKCPRCGEVFEPLLSRLAIPLTIAASLLGLFLLVSMVDIDNFNPDRRYQAPSKKRSLSITAPKSLEYKLAVINAHGFVKEDHVTVYRFRFLLNSLEAKTSSNKQQIADGSVKAVEILKTKYGKEVGLLRFMEEINRAIPYEKEKAKDFSLIAAYYVTVYGQQ